MSKKFTKHEFDICQKKHHLRSGKQKTIPQKSCLAVQIRIPNCTMLSRRVVGTTLTALKESLMQFNKSQFMLLIKNSVLPVCLLVSCTYCDYNLVKSTASTNFESFWVQFKSSPIILHVLHLLARLEKITKLFSDSAFHVSDSFPHWQKTGICKHHLELL